MGEYSRIVPWYNSKEWHKVYQDIFSNTSNILSKEQALNLLLVWKSRSPSLPSGIESTLTLLEVHIQDVKDLNSSNNQMLRLAYSTAIMRFVNHVLDLQTAKGASLYKAAKNLGVPDWIVDLRHNTAHGDSLPSIELLQEATFIAFKWLKENYWDKHKQIINDYITGQFDLDKCNENKITALINFCTSLSICAHPKLKMKNLADIPDISMRQAITSDIQDLFGDHVDLSNLKKVSVRALLNMVYTNSKRILKSKNAAKYVNKVLLGEDSLILSFEMLNVLNDRYFRKKNCLSKQYIRSFEVLLTFLHTNDVLEEFILDLIQITQDSHENSRKHWLAAQWATEILKALKKSNHFISRMNMNNVDNILLKSRKELKSLFYHWFPNEKDGGLILNLHKSVPKNLTSINFMLPIISSYNPYLTHFIRDILNLIEPGLPILTINKICKLAELISIPAGPVPSKIFTVEDLKIAYDDLSVIDTKVDLVDLDAIEDNGNRQLNMSPTPPQTFGIWSTPNVKYAWSLCPIGKLPWQLENEIHEANSREQHEELMETEMII